MSSAQSLSDKTVVVSPSERNSLDLPKEAKEVNSTDLEKALQDTSRSEERISSEQPQVTPSTEPVLRTVHGWRWFVICASVYLTAFTYGLDTTIAADVQSAVVETFGDVQQISWLGVGFLMGSVATVLPVGNLYELFNTKWQFIGGIALFELGSVVCGAAPSMDALIVGRVIAGMGGSAIYIGALTYFTVLTTEAERGKYISGLGIFWGVGAVLGPVIGGAFADSSATWRWAFYINLIIAAVCAPGIIFWLPSVKPVTGRTVKDRLAHIDWLGTVLSAAVWVFFVTVLTFAGSVWSWNDGRTIAFWVIFGVFLIAFIAQQSFSFLIPKPQRLFPVPMLKSRTQILLFVAMAATATTLFVPIYYIPLYFQFVHGDSAILAAVRLLPFIVVSMSLNLLFGFILAKIPHYASFYLVAGLFNVAGGAAMYTVKPFTSEASVYGFSILIAIGGGAPIQAGYSLASVKAAKNPNSSPQDIGHSIAFQNIAQIGSAAVALVIGGQVFQTYAFKYLSEALAGMGFSDDQLRAAVAGAQSTVFEEIDDATKALAVGAITDAISRVYILVVVAGAVSIVSSLFMKWERLFK